MSFLQFDKEDLLNLKYSLNRELLRTSRTGAHASSSIIYTNTRKYHGLLVAPQPQLDGGKHVLLSCMDETILHGQSEFHLSMRMYQGDVYHPKGHKYIRGFTANPGPQLTYRVGGCVLAKEHIFCRKESRVLIKYTLHEAPQAVTLRIKPFLAFRGVHSLSRCNTFAQTKHRTAENGASWRLYDGYSRLFLQFSRKVKYVHIPDWYYNIQYIREKERGYDYLEDLFVPGTFELNLKQGESVVVSAGLQEQKPAGFGRTFASESRNRIPRSSFQHCLQNAAREFVVENGKKTEVVAGYPWFGSWGRDTFIALPGLTLTQKDEETFHAVMKSMLGDLRNGLFPNTSQWETPIYNSADAPLWFFWALQQCANITGKETSVWKQYGKSMKSILENLKNGSTSGMHVQPDGLLWAGEHGKALTWMDAVVFGKPVTPRMGLAVELNALWYNAIAFCLQLAKKCKDETFISKWEELPGLVRQSFANTFWDEGKGYLADCIIGKSKDFAVRPNMIFAASLDHSPLDDDKKFQVLKRVETELLTPRGLRSLSPSHLDYVGKYEGGQPGRDRAYHQGTVWVWPLGAFAEAYLKIHGKKGKKFVKRLLQGFEAEMSDAGIGTVSEIFDGDPPHTARGAISQAWSVAELLRIKWLLDNR